MPQPLIMMMLSLKQTVFFLSRVEKKISDSEKTIKKAENNCFCFVGWNKSMSAVQTTLVCLELCGFLSVNESEIFSVLSRKPVAS